MSKRVVLKDDQEFDCTIENFEIFYKHILDYHGSGTSIHEHKGHYFTINNRFRSNLSKLIKNEDFNKK